VSGRTDEFDLGTLGLSSGESRRLELEVALDPFVLGGERYVPAPAQVPVRLDLTRLGDGYTMRLRFAAGLEGPCMRCLEEAGARGRVDALEVHQWTGEDVEQRSPYVLGDALDLRAWSRDALALALPDKIVCRADCLGLCATCGENLNAHPGHEHEAAPDPRWAKLAEVRFDEARGGGGRR